MQEANANEPFRITLAFLEMMTEQLNNMKFDPRMCNDTLEWLSKT